MASFIKYKTKSKKDRWLYKTYLGIDPLTGKEKRTTRRGFNTKKEAQQDERHLQEEYLKNGFGLKNKHKFKDIYDIWFNQYYKNGVKESTWVGTKGIFKNHVLPLLGNIAIEDITIKHCQDAYVKWANATRTKYKTINSYVKRIFEYAINQGLVTENPAEKVIDPVIERDEDNDVEDNFYSKEELQVFLESMEERKGTKLYSLFHTLAYTGMRQGEAIALTWEDIDMENKTISINKTYSRGENSRNLVLSPKTKSSRRVIGIDDTTIAILKKWKLSQMEELLIYGMNARKKEQLVFSNTKNKFISPSYIQKWKCKVQEENDLKPITTHGFRHTHCSLLFEAGANIPEVKARLGHGDVKTTLNIYTHVTKEQDKKTAQIFDDFMRTG